MDDDLNEDNVHKNQYHLDDDEFLSAPGGGLLKNEDSTQDSSEIPHEDIIITSSKDIDTNKENKKIKITKPTEMTYGHSDDTSDESEADDANANTHSRKYTSNLSDEDLDALTHSKDKQTNPNKNIGRQYSILLNDKSFLTAPEAAFPTNYIKTSKYTLLTFIPLNLFEQFRRVANIYFLIIIGIQLIPGVSPFPIATSLFPLSFILCVGAIKDGLEDWDRHKQDRIANSMGVLRLNTNTGQFKKCLSQHLQPSDIILLKRNERIPADCIVLSCDHSSGDNSGVCYINTSSMDGENAPKLRRAVQSTHALQNPLHFAKLRGCIKCPPNTKSLHGFTGALSIKKASIPSATYLSAETAKGKKSKNNEKTKLNGKDKHYGTITDDDDGSDEDDTYLAAQVHKTESKLSAKQRQAELEGDAITGLSDVNFVFRGSKLVNTDYVHALVLFVGRETKLMLNRSAVPFKFSKFEKILNTMIIAILLFNFILCVAFGIAAGAVNEPFPELEREGWFHGFFLDTCSWLILTSWMIPFSLYVTLELIKMIQAQWVAWDEQMTYNPENSPVNGNNSSANGNDLVRPNSISVSSVDKPALERRDSVQIDHSWDDEYGGAIRHAKTKNSNLNEELGHIDYIFTDKTGTLTQNQMDLSKCSVGGIKYQNDPPLSHTSISPDYESFAGLIQKIIVYSNKKHQLFKMHKKKHTNEELVTVVNNDLTQQFETMSGMNINKKYDKLNHGLSPMTQLQHNMHFLFNLLLCSSTVPAKVVNGHGTTENSAVANNSSTANSHLNGPTLAERNLITSHSKDVHHNPDDAEHEIKHTDTDMTDLSAAEGSEKLEFQSPSPDEVAFAEALYDHGMILEERAADGTIVLRLVNRKNKKEMKLKFKVLATLDFTARRKRMSVIVADEMGEIHLYTKGADSTLFRMCNEESKSLIHLSKRHTTSFARDGSRTLVVGWKKLSIQEYEEFDRFYREAEVALNNRQALIENAFSYCEHSLFLLGCTAVEDQMQDGVPESIYKLKDAKIKVIMLTGDKQETAVSIGRQSLIIGSNILDCELMFLQARAPTNPKDIDALEKQMRRVDKKLSNFIKQLQEREKDSVKMEPHSHNRQFLDETDAILDKQPALILNGDALEMCMNALIIDKFVILFEYCSTIICNRCDPSQKAMLVGMAKNRLSGVALAIGDGANDVSMIQASNVGIGIMGKEGTQAALAADFVIHRFRHITRLLFVHGRYSFLRTSQVSLLSLYKNMAFMLTVCYYGFYSLYSAQVCFDPYLMSAFNLMFTAIFPLCVGAFEQDIDKQTCLNHPKAYYYFKVNSFFNIKYFLFWMCTALWQSLVWFGLAVMVYGDNLDIWQSGSVRSGEWSKNGGLFVFGTQIFTTNVIVICAKMLCETYHWNWTYYASTLLGFVVYVITLAVLSNWLYLDSDMFQIMEFTLNTSMNWLAMIIQCVLCLLPGVLYNLWKRERFASLATILYEAQKFGYLTKNGIHRPTNDIIQDYLRR